MAGSHTRGARSVTGLIGAALLAVACGSTAPSAAPSAVPTPRVTPNPHLPSPATAEQVFAGLGRAGLRITANTATLGAEGSDVVTRIYATYLGWPLDVIQYRSATVLSKALTWRAGEPPGRGEPPIALAGVNILITWGPSRSGAVPGEPSGRQAAALGRLVKAVDLLLSPLKTRTTVPVKLSAPAATAPSVSASASAP